jgi:A/G-specific adenine glycosylase
VLDRLLSWYRDNARDFPWRAPDRTAWGVLVCEVMSQQTPAPRIVEPWRRWMARWPTPASLAQEPAGEAIRMWDRLGYPRRAIRLHAAARSVVERHGGDVPGTVDALRALPGVGDYTAAATAAFAHGTRVVVLDVNIRRVLARTAGEADPGPGAPTRAERARAQTLLPAAAGVAVAWNAATMELGALVCTARRPDCASCPLRPSCPGPRATAAATRAQRRGHAWSGTDRHVRGLVMAELRAAPGELPPPRLEQVWHDRVQLLRCLDGLVADGLVTPTPNGFRLPA